MLVGATACALQVTASRHRDPPAAATRTHAPCQPSATSFTRGKRSRMPGVPFVARWRRTRGRAVEGEGAARPRRRRPGEASCDCEGSAARLVDAMAWARAVGGAAWLARRGVLVWGGVVEKGCRAADARRATSTAGLSSVSFLLQPRHSPSASSSPLARYASALQTRLHSKYAFSTPKCQESGRRLAACGLRLRLRLRARSAVGRIRRARECRADPAASSTAASSTRQAAAPVPSGTF